MRFATTFHRARMDSRERPAQGRVAQWQSCARVANPGSTCVLVQIQARPLKAGCPACLESEMAKYRKKPVVIDAVQNTSPGVVMHWVCGLARDLELLTWEFKDGSVFIPTLEGTMEARPGDWIIRGVRGEFYPCKTDIFEATYEAES